MKIFSSVIALAYLLVMLALHSSVFIKNKVARRVLTYLNILLHGAFPLSLIIYNFSTKEMALRYFVSLFVYSLLSVIAYRVAAGSGSSMAADDDGGSDADEGSEETEGEI